MPRRKTARKAQKPVCFVLMPFTKAVSLTKNYSPLERAELDTIFAMYKKVFGRLGYEVKKSDSMGDILRDLVFQLDRADLIVADLTSLNPNVMYELGIRHGFTKKTLLLSQDLSELPFDLKTYGCLHYGWRTKTEQDRFSREARKALKAMDEDPDVKFGPVHSHLGTKRLALQEEDKRTTLRQLRALGAEMQVIEGACKEVTKLLKRAYPGAIEDKGTGWYVNTDNVDLHAEDPNWAQARSKWPPSFPSIDLFLSTRYVADEFDKFQDISFFTSALGSLRFGIHSASQTLAGFFDISILAGNVAIDIPLIIRAVEEDRFGEDLKLNTTHILSTADISQPAPSQVEREVKTAGNTKAKPDE